jgi:hypothetical protein
MGRKALLIAIVVSAFGCGAMTELKPGKCEEDKDCNSGRCDKTAKSCVDLDSGIDDALNSQNDTPYLAPEALAVGDSGTRNDVPVVMDLAAVDAPAVDAPVVDAAIVGCRTARDCPGTRSLCMANVCVECASADDCRDPGRAFCVGGTCVGCEQAGTNACAGKVCAPAGTPDAGGQCVECVSSATCMNPAAPICMDNACVACTNSEECAAKNKAKPACLTSMGTCVACISTSDCQSGGSLVCDTKNNTCVGCTSSTDCGNATPICTGGACVKCATNKQCLDRDISKPLCSNLGGCAQCLGHSDCGTISGKPFCDPATNECKACVTSTDCVSVDAPICQGNACMKCGTHKQCADRSPATQGCSSSGKCVGCMEKSHCSSTPATPECEIASNKCVQCLEDSGCSGATPLCVGNKCVACTNNDQCNKKNPAAPACVPSGGKAGTCVECKDNSTCQDGKVCNTETNQCVQCVDHTKCSGTTPLCSANQCVSCNGLAATECKSKNAAQPACAPTGACVQCTDNTGCTGNGNLLVCKPETFTCVQCLDDSKCESTTKRCKTETNACVQCLGNPDCSGTKPICDANNMCQPCQKDNECGAIGAGVDGVCMLDGHCATAAETIVVSATSGTLPATAADISAGKNLLVIQGNVSGSLTWNLTSRTQPMAIAGQNTGTLSSSLPIYVSGGDLYVKNLTVTGGSPGIRADTAGTLRLNRVRAVNNQGPGILVDRARFDISNCTVTGNGIVGGSGIRLTNLSTVTTGPKSLTYVSVNGNSTGGVSCDTDLDAPLTTNGVLATGNLAFDVAAACKFTPCTTASSACGVQP